MGRHRKPVSMLSASTAAVKRHDRASDATPVKATGHAAKPTANRQHHEILGHEANPRTLSINFPQNFAVVFRLRLCVR